MLYQGANLTLHQLDDGIVELVFDAPAPLTSWIRKPWPVLAMR